MHANIFLNLKTTGPILASLVAILALSGCSGEARVPVFPVTGKVTFQGKPPVGAQVVLHPVGGTSTDGVSPSGSVASDGSFNITSYDPGDGAPHGEYVGTLEWYKITRETGGPGPNVIPPRYANAKTSPIKVNVNGGPTEIQPIIIK